jgi:3-hydroxyisobutyrate dehydrogenase-like beta-hydroxyacid dehydrogenase
LLHPGEMGAAVGRCLAGRGHEVIWASQGRGPLTASRALTAGLADAGSVAEVARRAGVIISVCPPQAALDVARAITGFAGLYVDANAIAPQTAAHVAAIISGGGATYVDGGIIGPPPEDAGTTRLYLSGEHTAQVASLFDGTALDARVVTAGPFAASGLKMAYASWTKGSAALLLAARSLAEAAGVTDDLQAEWALSQQGLTARLRAADASAHAKGWRWVAEMEEIAATMERSGLPGGFHLAAAEMFRRFHNITDR